jgi:hypothetical protein
MAKVKMIVMLHRCIQDSQEYGSDDEHMVSRVFLTVISGEKRKDTYVDLKQAVGGNFETDPIEVGRPHDYRGPLDYEQFRREIESYFRSLVGAKGTMIHIENSTNVRMQSNIYVLSHAFNMEADDSAGGW